MTNNLIVKMVFGSHLYGTATPESDTDYKGIFLPTREQILLGRVPKVMSYNTKQTKEQGVKNGKDDIDCDLYSLPYFLEMACRGETIAMDMLHAGPEHIVEGHGFERMMIWTTIQKLRSNFYTKNCSAFVGYCRKQAAKYGIKGSRLAAMEDVILFLKGAWEAGINRLADCWEDLPTPEHVHKLPPNPKDRNNQRLYQVAGRKYIESANVRATYLNIQTIYDRYGARAQQAKDNEGIDWKAVSHALRAALQVKDMFLQGGWSYPLVYAEWLKAVKQGELDYTTEVAPTLEYWMDKIEQLAAESTLPEKVDRKYWDGFLIETYERFVL